MKTRLLTGLLFMDI